MHSPPVDSPPHAPASRDRRTCRGGCRPSVRTVAPRWSRCPGTRSSPSTATSPAPPTAGPSTTPTSRRRSAILTDWVWDPWTMRALCAVAVLWLVLHALGMVARAVAGGHLCCSAHCSSRGSRRRSTGSARSGRTPWTPPTTRPIPSGHAMTATVVCGLLLWLMHLYGAGRALRRTRSPLAVVSVVGVGLTRIWLGVHWPVGRGRRLAAGRAGGGARGGLVHDGRHETLDRPGRAPRIPA